MGRLSSKMKKETKKETKKEETKKETKKQAKKETKKQTKKETKKQTKKEIFYEDELNDDFSESKIEPIKIDGNYKYEHGLLWGMAASFVYRVIFTLPAYIYTKLKFKYKVKNKKVLKKEKSKGIFLYGNHTQEIVDTFIPSLVTFPKRVYVVAHPDNVSIKGMKTLNKMLGAIPIPGDIESSRNFLAAIAKRIKKKNVIMIYPEAHVWPYYTKIRNYPDTSFKYPVELDAPVYCLTTTYQDKQMVVYADGPFYADKNLNKKQAQKDLRDRVYATQVERAKNNNVEIIKYTKKEKSEKQLKTKGEE